jgi:hypothetical protein
MNDAVNDEVNDEVNDAVNDEVNDEVIKAMQVQYEGFRLGGKEKAKGEKKKQTYKFLVFYDN